MQGLIAHSMLALKFLLIFSEILIISGSQSVNVILILTDDLGYGDLGWKPFYSSEMSSVQAPNLLRMSQEGVTLTNFHAASPVCSPSRASIMLGLFPWRVGIDFIYSQDLKEDGSQELDHEQLPLIPNIALAFHEQGYYTAHVGKWHLGKLIHMNFNTVLLPSFNFTVCMQVASAQAIYKLAKKAIVLVPASINMGLTST